jgi:hypothetical protein
LDLHRLHQFLKFCLVVLFGFRIPKYTGHFRLKLGQLLVRLCFAKLIMV